MRLSHTSSLRSSMSQWSPVLKTGTITDVLPGKTLEWTSQ